MAAAGRWRSVHGGGGGVYLSIPSWRNGGGGGGGGAGAERGEGLRGVERGVGAIYQVVLVCDGRVSE